ncbi:MAG: RHS repeat domain-containing protein, partial [Gemmataceae bacterium]
QPGVDLSYIKLSTGSTGDAGDQYTGLDRFGRVVDQRWINGSGTDLDRYQYGYDRDGNRLYKDNRVLSSLSEVYTYDSLNQIASYKLGTLNTGKTDITGSPTNSQSWDYDAVGNWDSVTTNSATQTRTVNKQNEITSVSGATTPTYDSNGNLTTDENNYRFVYDAWNKVVQVKNSSNVVIVTYGRDALHRHVTDTVGSTVTDRFFSSDWQLLETKVGSNTVTRNVWSPVYVDGLVLRDRDTDANGTFDERLYALQDANWNTTSLVNSGGTVQERYTYTPFGQVTFRDGSGPTLSGSAKDWVFLHQGGERIAAGDYEFRNRVYSPSLGRWLSNDPLGFNAGDQNWYRSIGNNPVNGGDPEGLFDGQQASNLVPITGFLLPVYGGTSFVPASSPLINLTPPGAIIICGMAATYVSYNLGNYLGEKIGDYFYPKLQRPAKPTPNSTLNAPQKPQKPKIKPEKQKTNPPPKIPPSLDIQEKDSRMCDFYKAWCEWGAKCRKNEKGWGTSVGTCISCYNECQKTGAWDFSICPIAGRHPNAKGPRWPGPNDDWEPVFPSKDKNGNYDCFEFSYKTNNVFK